MRILIAIKALFNFQVGIQKSKKRKYSTFSLNKLIIKKKSSFFNVCELFQSAVHFRLISLSLQAFFTNLGEINDRGMMHLQN